MRKEAIGERNILYYFLIFLGFSLLISIIIGGAYFNKYDTYWYRQWIFDIQKNGLFTVYSRAKDIELDYPPVYLFFLYLTGLAYKIVGNDCLEFTQMILLKFWPIFFYMLCAVLLYVIFSKRGSQLTGFVAAGLWLMNPSLIFNVSMWGQTDSLLCFVLLLSFWALEEKRPVLACVLFAVAGLTKYQCLFFLPVLLLYLARNEKPLALIKGIGAAAVTVILVFLPFMIGAGDISLFFKVYFGGAGKYPYCTLNAFNLYGLIKLNWVEETTTLIGLPASLISGFFIAVTTLLLMYLFVFGKRTCPWVGGLLFMQCLFMLTTRMHERYQIAVLPFALMAYLVHRNKSFLWIFVSLSAITAVNQAFVLLPITADRVFGSTTPWSGTDLYNSYLAVFSLVNIVIFAWCVYACIKFFISKEKVVHDIQ